MKRTEQQFLNLLQAGLWQREADTRLFRGPVDWNELFRLSREQTVMGVVYDGIAGLPKEQRPPRAFLMNWFAQVSYIEDLNREQNRVLFMLYDKYVAEGFTPVLLKGQSLAACYPNPLHRNCGDIDWLFGEADYRRSIDWALQSGLARDAIESNNHLEFSYEGQVVENHVECSKLFRKSDQQYLQKLTREWFPAGASTCRIEEREVPVPPHTFNAVFLLLHAVKHLMGKGVGLRQVCDWARFLHIHRADIDEALLNEYLRGFHLEHFWSIFGRLLIDYIGFPAEEMPALRPGYERSSRRLRRHIFLSGNFGQYSKMWRGRPGSYWRSKYFAFSREMRTLWLLYRISPSDTRSFLTFFLKRGLKQVVSDLR